MLIAGDIGGTKTDLAIYSRESGPHTPLAQTEVHSADYPQLAGVYLAGGIALHPVDLLQNRSSCRLSPGKVASKN
jgi:glucokinase